MIDGCRGKKRGSVGERREERGERKGWVGALEELTPSKLALMTVSSIL